MRDRDGAIEAVSCARERVAELTPLPLPGHRTWQRWTAFADEAVADLSVARLVEGHFDGVAILNELDHPVPDGLLGVWAARPEQLTATRTSESWLLDGTKPFCSGSSLLDHALITASTTDGPMLFLIDAGAPHFVPGTWEPLGMLATRSEAVHINKLEIARSAQVGGTNAYVARPGFGIGGCGVAACWWGGTRALLADLEHFVRHDDVDEVRAAVATAESVLRAAAEVIDHGPISQDRAIDLAARTRSAAASAGRRCISVASSRLGTTALAQRAVSRRLADLTMYLTQHKNDAATERTCAC